MNIGRNAVLAAGWPESVPATTIDRQCGSSQQAVHFAAQGVMAGAYDIVDRRRRRVDEPRADGRRHRWAATRRRPASPRALPGGAGQPGRLRRAHRRQWGLSREQLDEYSRPVAPARGRRGRDAGGFDREIVPVTSAEDGGAVDADETIRPATTAEGWPGSSRPSTTPRCASGSRDLDWRITAGNSSPLTDGASAALIMGEDAAAAARPARRGPASTRSRSPATTRCSC